MRNVSMKPQLRLERCFQFVIYMTQKLSPHRDLHVNIQTRDTFNWVGRAHPLFFINLFWDSSNVQICTQFVDPSDLIGVLAYLFISGLNVTLRRHLTTTQTIEKLIRRHLTQEWIFYIIWHKSRNRRKLKLWHFEVAISPLRWQLVNSVFHRDNMNLQLENVTVLTFSDCNSCNRWLRRTISRTTLVPVTLELDYQSFAP